MTAVARPGSSVLVDTNLLLVLLVGLLDRSLLTSFKRTRQYTVDDFEILSRFVAQYHDTVVTPHTLTETSNLLSQLEGDHRAAAFALFAHLIPKWREESVAASRVSSEGTFARLGVTDTALKLIAGKRMTVITSDLDLYLDLQHAGLDAVNFNHLRAQGW